MSKIRPQHFLILTLFVNTVILGQNRNDFSKKYNTWAFGMGVSNLSMHGDLRSIGTKNEGSIFNIGGYIYIDRMFNPILGLELKIDYSKLGSASQKLSEGYDVRYCDCSDGNLISKGRKFGFQIEGIINMTNLWKLNSSKWNLAFMAGFGFHRYNSELMDSDTNKGIEYENVSSSFLTSSLSLKRKISKHLDIELRQVLSLNFEDHLDASISDKQEHENFFTTLLGIVYKFGNKKKYAIWLTEKDETKFKPISKPRLKPQVSPKTKPKSVAKAKEEKDKLLDKKGGVVGGAPDNVKGIKQKPLDKKGGIVANQFDKVPVGIEDSEEKLGLLDQDKDGVADRFDREPNTVKGAKVYGDGTALDSDKDGLRDHEDKCPFIAGAEADQGCRKYVKIKVGDTKEKVIRKVSRNIIGLSRDIFFEPNSDKIKKESYSTLDAISKIMLQYPKTKYHIDGHTDNRLSYDYNIKLSENRAKAVVKYLESKNVESDRLYPRGFGETRPTHSNENEQGRKFNRRVEIDFIEPNTEKGVRIYPPGTNTLDVIVHKDSVSNTEEIKFNLKDTDEDGVPDRFDKEPDTPAGALVYGNGVSIDTDRDKIPDHSDKCPMIPGITKNQGCPIEKTISKSPVPSTKDTDGDGVIDRFDKEPNTPAGALVYGNGVSIDTDYDKIPDHSDKCPMIPGITKNQGCPIEKTISKSPVPSTKDTDGDGVIDRFDKEPNTPAGALVYGNGVSIDTDYDKIPDHSDKCPIIPGVIENLGCPIESIVPYEEKAPGGIDQGFKETDTDGDGIIDGQDLCPKLKGIPFRKGCPDQESFDKNISLRISALATNILFEPNQHTLTNETTKILNKILRIMKYYTSVKYEIAVHTSNKQNKKFSMFLSKRRAKSIMKYLLDNGISRNRLESEGYGETKPIYPSIDAATSELNNRVEFNFKGSK